MRKNAVLHFYRKIAKIAQRSLPPAAVSKFAPKPPMAFGGDTPTLSVYNLVLKIFQFLLIVI